MALGNVTNSMNLIEDFWDNHSWYELNYAIVQAPNYPFQIMVETLGWSTTSPLTDGTNGSAYSQSVVATGGTGSYTYAVTSGALPTGLSCSSAGVISGTPSANGVFTATITATDTGGNTGSKAFQITINAGSGAYAASYRHMTGVGL